MLDGKTLPSLLSFPLPSPSLPIYNKLYIIYPFLTLYHDNILTNILYYILTNINSHPKISLRAPPHSRHSSLIRGLARYKSLKENLLQTSFLQSLTRF